MGFFVILILIVILVLSTGYVVKQQHVAIV